MSATDRLANYVPVRTIVVFLAIWMTWEASAWSMAFATDNARNGIEIAAIVAAVTGPITVFAGYVFKAYVESRAV